ncbi:zwei Ig domain protein zig-8-like [Homarus americanus]|uniref:zwei Ig domain protein zig-8-like n=1 Tax=Homarus americanus TaxID=6706 RepID=UPI001C473351|nr:zwei Ig domain protein zig-8-like [Homarus americanus]
MTGVSGWSEEEEEKEDGVISQNTYQKRELVVGPREATTEYITPEEQNNTEVVAQLGGTATIKCYTYFLGDEMVTWMKRDEDQLLTAGGEVYSSEKRYSVAHVRHQKLWELSLRDVRMSDAGLYECQLTTHPPASLFFTLKVVEARAVVAGGPEVHVHTGVKLRLHCTVELATEPPDYIFWFHNDTMINYLPKRPLKVVNHHFASSLVISNVTWADAGSYRCEPHLATPANLTLHVVEGEKHAALHNGHSEGAEQDTTAAADSAHLSPLMVAAAASCLLIFASAGHLYTLDSDWS